MKRSFLIFGAGVIGSTYGGLLSKAGHKVAIYARTSRLETIRSNGLFIRRNKQSTAEKVDVEIISELGSEINYDYVIVAIRNEQVKAALPVLSTVKTENFVFMVNNPSGYADWTNALGYEKVIPAFPGVGGKISDGVVVYEIVRKAIQTTTIGELSGLKSPRLLELKTILKEAGFPVSLSEKMDAWQKTHVALVAPLAEVIYYDGGNNYTVAKNKNAIRQMNLALKENLRFLHEYGIGIEPRKMNAIRFVPDWLLTFIMRLVFNTRWAETVICNHALNARPEMKAVSSGFLDLAKQKGAELPEFEKLIKYSECQ